MTCYEGFIVSTAAAVLMGDQMDAKGRQPASAVLPAGMNRLSSLLLLAVSLATATLIGVTGCSSSSVIKAGAISITDPSGSATGQLTSLTTGAQAALSMTPVSDKTNDGVDWTVTCGGNPLNGSLTGGACGTFAPAHTPSGVVSLYTAPANIPVGTNVTITAAVTGDPSAQATLVLPIVAPAVTITFSAPPPASVVVNGRISANAVVGNDPAGAGVSWSVICGSSDCGSFAPQVTSSTSGTSYTAPASVPSGGTVTIKATSVTDTTKSVSKVVNILSAPPPVSVTLNQTKVQVGINSTAFLISTVANDSANKGVDWSLSCGSSSTACGTITSHTTSGAVATYEGPSTVPSGNPVTITASATALPSATAAAQATISSTVGMSITLTAPLSVATGGVTSNVTATVTNDSAKQGINWSVACGTGSACGTITGGNGGGSTSYSATAKYTAPATIPDGGIVTIIATPVATGAGNPGLAGVTITQAPPTVTFLQQPSASLATNAGTPVSAVVTNDPASGGVTWSVQCSSTVSGGCGYVSPYQTASGNSATYIAPPVVPSGKVTIVATSESNPAASASSTAVAIATDNTLSVHFIPLSPTQIQESGTVNLTAAVSNDTTSSGIDWQVCPSGCGYFTIVPAIPVTTTMPAAFPNGAPPVTATSVSGWPSGLPISYTAPSTPPTGGKVAIVATAHLDGITSAAASVTIASGETGPALNGVVQAGTRPVAGAMVALYAAGTSGYGSSSSLVYSPSASPYATTDSAGNFTIPAGYSCPQGTSQMYLISTGGSVAPSAANPNLVLMTALGPCNALSSSSLVVNEVTSVSGAWALAHFAPEPVDTGLTTYLNIGSSSSNTAGLANAFAAAQNLVDISTGQPRFTVPAGNAAVPYAEINTLADVINTCAVTSGGSDLDGSACGQFFSYAISNPPGQGAYYAVPTDTLQAAMQVAQHPGGGNLGYAIQLGNLYGLVTHSSPFQPILSSAPQDFSISLNYTGGGGLSSSSGVNYLALDASGNLWMSDTAGNKVIEWNNLGAATTSPSGFANSNLVSPGALAIDTSGDVWICAGGKLTELTNLGMEAVGSPFKGGGLSNTCQGMAIDGPGNIWVLNSNTVSKFNNLGQALTPDGGFTIPVSPTDSTTVSLYPPIAIDASNNVWVGVLNPLVKISGALSLGELHNASGLPYNLNPPTDNNPSPSNFVLVSTSNSSDQTQIAIDSSGNVWALTSNSPGIIQKVSSYSGTGIDPVTGFYPPFGTADSLSGARGVAIDGSGKVWAASQDMTDLFGNLLGLPNLSEFNPAVGGSTSAFYVSQSLTNHPLSVSVDSAGNVWVLLNNNTITEYVGIATPAVTPLSTAVAKKKLGAKP